MIIAIMLNCLFSLGGILTLGFLIYKLTDIEKKYLPFFSICMIIVIEFFLGSFNILSFGTFTLYILLGLYLGYTIWKRPKEVKRYLENYSVRYFCGMSIACVLFYLCTNQYFMSWDEYSHWGPFMKAIKEYDMLHIYNDKLEFVHPSYQQGQALLYYYFSFFFPQYTEWMTYAVYAIGLISCVTPVVNETIYKKKYLFLYVLIPFVFRLFSSMNPFTSIYCDVILGAMSGVLLYYVFSLKSLNLCDVFLISLSMIAITQIKDMGVLFVAVIFAIFILKVVQYRKVVGRKNIFFFLFLPLLSILLVRNYWNFLIDLTGNNVDQFTNLSIPNILNGCIAYLKGDDPYFQEVVRWVYNAFVNRSLSWIPFSTGINMQLLLLFLTALIILKKRKDIIMCLQLMVVPIASVGYLLLLFIVYRFTMSQQEAEMVNSFERYFGSFLLMWTIFLLLIYIEIIMTSTRKNVKFVIRPWTMVILLVVFLCVYDIVCNDPLWLKSNKVITGRRDLESMCEDITKEIEDYSDILIFGSGIPSYNLYRYHYMLMPNDVRYDMDENFWKNIDLQNYIQNNNIDYVVIANCEEEFYNMYRESFGDNLEKVYLNDFIGAIYKVVGNEYYFLNYISSDIQ